MDRKFLILSSVFFAAAFLFTAATFFQEQFLSLTRAQRFYNPSPTKSLILAYPVKLKADGFDQSTITVFVKNDEGVPIKDKEVRIQTNLGSVRPTSAKTDENGKAEFVITSEIEGVANITAIVDNTTIQQRISVKFE